MKKYFGLVFVVFAFAFFGCDNGTGGESEKTIDSRLVGGKWYDGSSGTSNIYYKFTSTDFITTLNGPAAEIATPAFTENGQVKSTVTDTVLLSYVFVRPSEYDDEIEAAKISGDEVLQYKWQRRKLAASSGNMVRFTVSGVSVEWARWENVQ